MQYGIYCILPVYATGMYDRGGKKRSRRTLGVAWIIKQTGIYWDAAHHAEPASARTAI
jgi:hypothetical protein